MRSSGDLPATAASAPGAPRAQAAASARKASRAQAAASAPGAPRAQAAASARKASRAQAAASAPAVASARTDAPRPAPAPAEQAQRPLGMLGTLGERPPGPFGGLPVSELAILIGAVALIAGVVERRGGAIVVGSVICALAVLEVSAREHFSGFRSHAALLAAFPALGVMFGVAAALGTPGAEGLAPDPRRAGVPDVFWLLRRRFAVARHARAIRPPPLAGAVRAHPGVRRLIPASGARARRPAPSSERPALPGVAHTSSVTGGSRSVAGAVRQVHREHGAAVGRVGGAHRAACCSAAWRTIARPRPLPWRPRAFSPR